MIQLAKTYFNIHRSITGRGVLKSLILLKEHIPNLKIKKIKSGEKIYNWTVPPEWNVTDAYIKNANNKKIVDFKKNNLSLINYSVPINKIIDFSTLRKHLHSRPDLPNAIPYITSYYKKYWGFCVKHSDIKKKFIEKKYKVVIKSNFKKRGDLHYADLIIKGKSKKEILFHTYVCHPKMANNETSGPILCTYLAKYLTNKNNYYTYRFVFVPETVGAIAYIKKNYAKLKKNFVAGYVITCAGDEGNFSYLESKSKNSLSNKIAKNTFNKLKLKFRNYTFVDRGSDERQYNSPNVDLSVGSIMKTKYTEYKEYHSSLDNFNFVTEKGLKSSLSLLKKIVSSFEDTFVPISTNKCEPFLTKYNLIETVSLGGNSKNNSNLSKKILDFLAYSDGNHTIDEIKKITNTTDKGVYKIKDLLLKLKLIR